MAPDAATLTRIESLAAAVAKDMGDDEPESAVVYATARATANAAASGADVDTDQSVYVIVLHGDFVAGAASRPAGTPAPTGHVVRIVWDPDTGMITDWGIGDNEPDAAKLGTGFSLDISDG